LRRAEEPWEHASGGSLKRAVGSGPLSLATLAPGLDRIEDLDDPRAFARGATGHSHPGEGVMREALHRLPPADGQQIADVAGLLADGHSRDIVGQQSQASPRPPLDVTCFHCTHGNLAVVRPNRTPHVTRCLI
jgi:hypothetical protein